MGNVALSIDAQIEKLRSRGLNFDGFEMSKVKEILLDIGYYRLGFYWYDLRKNQSTNDFQENTQFQTIVDLYYLDNDIRYILTKYLNRIEVNFRTNVVYYMSMKFKPDPIWFASDQVMTNDFLEELPSHYNEDFISKHFVIKNHHQKYPEHRYAPAWKTMENFTFGALLKIYENVSNSEIKERISEKLGIKPIVKFQKVFRGLVHVRNRCAHGAILYNYGLPKSLPTIPYIEYESDNRSNLKVVVQTIHYVLGSISQNRANDFQREMNECLEKFENSGNDAFRLYSAKSGLSNL